VIRRRLWIAFLLPLLAGGAAYGTASQEPQRYNASAVVAIPSSISESDSALTVYSDNFEETLGSDAVLARLSRDTGISQRILKAGISATRLQRSIMIEVSFTGDDRLKAAQVVTKGARYTLDGLAKPKVAAAKAAVTLAQSRYDRARRGLYRFYRTTGLVIPVEVYTTKLTELSQLERDYGEALQDRTAADGPSGSNDDIGSNDERATPDAVPGQEPIPADVAAEQRRQARLANQRRQARLADQLASQRRAAAIQTKIGRLQKELADLRPKMLRYQELDADLTGSLSLLTAVQKDLLDASSLSAASSSPLTLGQAVITPISRTQVIARSVGISMGLAFVLALGLLAVLELLWPSRGSGRHLRANSQPSAVVPEIRPRPDGPRGGPGSDQSNASPSWL
jgi:hypothetical protein